MGIERYKELKDKITAEGLVDDDDCDDLDESEDEDGYDDEDEEDIDE